MHFRHMNEIRILYDIHSVLSNEDDVSWSWTQHSSPGEIQTRALAIKSSTLPAELTVLSSFCDYNMRLIVRKPVFGVSDLVPDKPGCTTTEDR